MFGLLIWSKNRAAQLDLLLSSIEKFCSNQFKIKVLYSNQGSILRETGEYRRGYDRCKEYHPTTTFIEEKQWNVLPNPHHLGEQTKEVLQEFDYFAVSTDDTVIFKPFYLSTKDMENCDIFSLRYGLNTIVQDPFIQSLQPALTKYEEQGNIITWDSRLYHCTNNYGFQFGHDMHIYTKRYLELIKDFKFSKVNELESWLFNNCRNKINPFIRSFKHSVAVNIPNNNMSGITQTDNSLPINEVNKKFLLGYRFDLENLNNVKIVGAHQLLPLTMN